MTRSAIQTATPQPPAETPARDEHIAPAPRISIQAFCESVETAAAVQSAGEDRRMAKAHLKIQMGGMTAAVEAYRSAPTPNVIILEFESRPESVLAGLDSLAELCDPGTRVIVIGRHNDVTLYRELVRRGLRAMPAVIYELVLEFGTAEALDSLFLRPALMYAGVALAPNTAIGIAAGKLTANVIFYVPTIISYELLNRRERPIIEELSL